MRMIRKTFQKDGYQQFWFSNNLVMATSWKAAVKMRKVKETFARCV